MSLAPLLALVARGPTHATITTAIPHRAHVAAILATALTSGGSQHVRRVQLAAEELERRLAPAGLSPAAHAPHWEAAESIRQRVVALDPAARTPTLVAAIRTLLADVLASEALDRAVRDAARAHGHEVVAHHWGLADAIVEEVLP